MDTINGYPAVTLRALLLDRLGDCTPSAIRRRLLAAEQRLNAADGPTFIALGETCAPSVRLRELGVPMLGGGFFDNLVTPVESVVRLLDEDFGQLLQLRNLVVGRWENHDSVLDSRYVVFFHHYFHLRGAHEKDDLSEGARRRRIDEADIPLFLPAVLAQFEYLTAKLRLVLRAPQRKILVLRLATGGPLPRAASIRLTQALERFGARNAEMRVAHATPLPAGDFCDASLHRLVPEDGERWGAAQAWRAVVA